MISQQLSATTLWNLELAHQVIPIVAFTKIIVDISKPSSRLGLVHVKHRLPIRKTAIATAYRRHNPVPAWSWLSSPGLPVLGEY